MVPRVRQAQPVKRSHRLNWRVGCHRSHRINRRFRCYRSHRFNWCNRGEWTNGFYRLNRRNR